MPALLAQFDIHVNWWVVLATATYLLALLSVPSVLLKRRGQPQVALSWVLTLFLLPIVGLFLWWAIGRRYLKRQRRRRTRAAEQVQDALEPLREELPELPLAEDELFPVKHLPDDMIQGVFPAVRNNAVELLVDAAAGYPAMEQAIRAARRHVHVMFYIWEPDSTGRRFRDLLAEKAAEGVEVRVLYDAVGSSSLSRRFMDPLRSAGGEVGVFSKPNLLSFSPHINFRNHRKLVVVDGGEGFLGGLNIGDQHLARWHDTMLHVRGPVVDQLQEVFDDDWHFTTGRYLRSLDYFGRWAEACDADGNAAPRCGEAICQLVASGPHMTESTTRDAFFAAATQVRQRIYITMPYFLPDAPLETALRTAVYRGVDVRVLVPARSDVRLVRLAARSYYPSLLAAGVRIFEYRDDMVHAKNLVLDDEVSLVGSANMDLRSFRLNFELSCFVKDRPLNARLAALFDRNLARSDEVTLADLANRSYFTQLAEAAANLLSPLL